MRLVQEIPSEREDRLRVLAERLELSTLGEENARLHKELRGWRELFNGLVELVLRSVTTWDDEARTREWLAFWQGVRDAAAQEKLRQELFPAPRGPRTTTRVHPIR